jgi:type II secretory pathway component PulC
MKKLFDKIFKKKNQTHQPEDFTSDIPVDQEVHFEAQQVENLDNQDNSDQQVDNEDDVIDMNEPTNKWVELIEQTKQFVSLNIHKLKLKFNKNEQVFNQNKQTNLRDEFEFYVKKIELDKWSDQLYLPETRKLINQVTLASLVAISTYGSGKTLALMLKGVDQTDLVERATTELTVKQLSLNQFEELRSANLFKTDRVESKPSVSGPQKTIAEKCEKADQKSRLPIKLVNTIVLQDSVKSVASVQVRTNDSEQFRVGESIQDMAKIGRIERLKVIFKNLETGDCEYIDSPDKAKESTPIRVMSPSQSQNFKQAQSKKKGIKNEGNDFSISKSVIDEQLKDLSGLLTQARAIKIVNPDGSMSFKITEIEPGGIFATLGVRDEDIIKEIDGRPIESMNQIMGLFSKLKNISSLNLTVERGGAPV